VQENEDKAQAVIRVKDWELKTANLNVFSWNFRQIQPAKFCPRSTIEALEEIHDDRAADGQPLNRRPTGKVTAQDIINMEMVEANEEDPDVKFSTNDGCQAGQRESAASMESCTSEELFSAPKLERRGTGALSAAQKEAMEQEWQRELAELEAQENADTASKELLLGDVLSPTSQPPMSPMLRSVTSLDPPEGNEVVSTPPGAKVNAFGMELTPSPVQDESWRKLMPNGSKIIKCFFKIAKIVSPGTGERRRSVSFSQDTEFVERATAFPETTVTSPVKKVAPNFVFERVSTRNLWNLLSNFQFFIEIRTDREKRSRAHWKRSRCWFWCRFSCLLYPYRYSVAASQSSTPKSASKPASRPFSEVPRPFLLIFSSGGLGKRFPWGESAGREW
jgi:hypothetical protein